MNLKQLLKRIDWTKADESQKEWAKSNASIDLEFEEGRTSLIYESLLEFSKETLTEDERNSQQAKRWLLSQIGVWPQVVTILQKEGILEHQAAAESNHSGEDGSGEHLGDNHNPGQRPAPVNGGSGPRKRRRHRRSRHKGGGSGDGGAVGGN